MHLQGINSFNRLSAFYHFNYQNKRVSWCFIWYDYLKLSRGLKLFLFRASYIIKLSDRSNFNAKIHICMRFAEKQMKIYDIVSANRTDETRATNTFVLNICGTTVGRHVTLMHILVRGYIWVCITLRIKWLWNCLRISAEITTPFAT